MKNKTAYNRNMKKFSVHKFILAILFICIFFHANAQNLRDSLIGNFSCKLVAYYHDTTTFYTELYLTEGTKLNSFFANDGFGILLNTEFTLYSDSTFVDSSAMSYRYGHFYSNDSVYLVNGDYYGAYSAYYGKKQSLSIEQRKSSDKLYFDIYPNPANKIIHIRNKEIKGEMMILLRDNKGAVVWNNQYNINNLNESITIDISDYPRGIYLVSIFTINNMYNKKVIIN